MPWLIPEHCYIRMYKIHVTFNYKVVWILGKNFVDISLTALLESILVDSGEK